MALCTGLEGRIVAGRYELRAHLATGGMAAIYRGWDQRMRRPVAVKLLRDDRDDLDTGDDPGDPRFIELARFRREARAVAALHSPHIVKVYDFVVCDGRTYLIMEFVDGPDLKQRILAAGPLAVEEALTYAIHVCRALAQTHAHGYIHRDIKPQNILLPSSGITKLTDFGIVRVGGAPSLTASGLVLGTADYIAPEQAQGLTLGPPSDLYSLGIVLFEMLAAAVPFTGATATAVALRHTTEPLPPLRPRNPDVPPLVERIIRRAGAKDPARRFASAFEMETALAHALASGRRHSVAAATLIGAASPRPDTARAMGSAPWPHSSVAIARAAGTGEAQEPDWHDVPALLPTMPQACYERLGRTAAIECADLPRPASTPARDTCPTLLLRRGTRARIAAPSRLRRPFRAAILPLRRPLMAAGLSVWRSLGSARGQKVVPRVASARLALVLGVALLLGVAVLVLRMLP